MASSFSFFTFGISVLFHADLMFEMCLIPLNSSSIRFIFYCLFVLFLVFDAIFDLLTDVCQSLQVMSPTTWSSTMTRSSTTRSPASSPTPRISSSTLLRHQTRTWMTLRSASYSLKYTDNTPITAVQKVCLLVSRHCLSCSIEQGNLWEKEMSISQLVLVSRKNTYSAHSKFSKNTRTEKMVDRSGKPVGAKQLKCTD